MHLLGDLFKPVRENPLDAIHVTCRVDGAVRIEHEVWRRRATAYGHIDDQRAYELGVGDAGLDEIQATAGWQVELLVQFA